MAVAIPPSVNFYPLTRDHGGGGAVEDLLGHDGGGQVVTQVVRYGGLSPGEVCWAASPARGSGRSEKASGESFEKDNNAETQASPN